MMTTNTMIITAVSCSCLLGLSVSRYSSSFREDCKYFYMFWTARAVCRQHMRWQE